MKIITLITLSLLTVATSYAQQTIRVQFESPAQAQGRYNQSRGGFAGVNLANEIMFNGGGIPSSRINLTAREKLDAKVKTYTKLTNGIATISGYVSGKTTNTVTIRYRFDQKSPKEIYTLIRDVTDTTPYEVNQKVIAQRITGPFLVSLTNDLYAVVQAKYVP